MPILLFLLGPALRRGTSLKMQTVCFFQSVSQIGTLEALIGRKSAILDVDWSRRRFGTLETLIGSRAVCEVRLCPSLKVSHGEWMVNYEYYGFGLSGRSVPPQVDSDKLRNELHS